MLDLLHRTRKTACASLLACVVLGAFGAGVAHAEELPRSTKPGDETSIVGKHVILTVTGTHLATLTAQGLPAGVETITKETEETWTISGTPTTAQPATTVTLEAKNKQGEPVSPVTTEFKCTAKASQALPTPPTHTHTTGHLLNP